MDLKALLAASKAKASKTTATHKPVAIANQDRPYSEAELAPPPPTTSLDNEITQTNYPHEIGKKLLPPEKKLSAYPTPPDNNCFLIESKTGNKPTTNWQQTDNKLATNRQQTGNKLATNSKIKGNKGKIKEENWQQTGNKLATKLATNWQQTGNKLATIGSFSKLIGLQRDIIIFMCQECKNSRSRTTESLTLEYMAHALKHSAGAIKTTIQRLEKKECLKRVEFKNGRGGWSCYELPDSIYHDVIRSETGNKPATNRQQTGNKLATEPATNASSSSSIYKTTTTGLSEEWNFDITPYARFGFTASQLKQLALLGVISAPAVEQSLIEFTYDLDNQTLPHIKTTKINFLMGLLRAGHSYVSEGFKNELESTISEMARRAEGKRKKLSEEKFGAWEANLSEAERKTMEEKLPLRLISLYQAHGISNEAVRIWLFNYYLEMK